MLSRLSSNWAAINATGNGDLEVVAAVIGKKIRVFQMGFSVSAAVNIAWKSGSTVKINARSFPADGGMETGNVDPGWIVETAAGEALNINLSGEVNVRGELNYTLA